ncbi:MAG: alpha/beta hydrolase family protein, partial [Saprospiraceae bacterium]
MKALRQLVLFTFTLLLFSSSAQAQLIDYKKVRSFSVEDLKAYWKKMSIPQIITKVKYPVDVYDVAYETEWIDGSRIKATGLYFVPVKPKKDAATLIYNHGTIVDPDREIDFNGESTILRMFATDGYAVIAPDYVGLGGGDKQHLYHHAKTEAYAGIDFLKIVPEIDKAIGLKRNEQLFITGYSQGGHATMAVHRELQNNHPNVNITATSPMSGAYDLSGVQSEIMEIEYSQPHYLPYLMLGYTIAYDIYPMDEFYDTVFRSPWNEKIPGMFDGSMNRGEINDALPKVPKDMMNEELYEQYANDPDFFFKKLLEQNNMYDWKPEVPVQICYCENDEEVLSGNAKKAYEYF